MHSHIVIQSPYIMWSSFIHVLLQILTDLLQVLTQASFSYALSLNNIEDHHCEKLLFFHKAFSYWQCSYLIEIRWFHAVRTDPGASLSMKSLRNQ